MDSGLDDLLSDEGFSCGDDRLKNNSRADTWASKRHGQDKHQPKQDRWKACEVAREESSSYRQVFRSSVESKASSSRDRNDADDVDSLLRDLQLDDDDHDAQAVSRGTGRFMKNSSQRHRELSPADDDNDCDDVVSSTSVFTVLGGEDARTGKQGSLARKIATSDLHCVQCDMAVNRWTGKAWASDADYMFFRNTAPDRYKMASMLVPRKGSSAYACQCSWIAVNDFVQIRIGQRVKGKTLKWTPA